MAAPIEKMLDEVEWEEVKGYGAGERNSAVGDLYMTHKGVMRIMGHELPCAILSNGQRIFYGDLIDEMVGQGKRPAETGRKPEDAISGAADSIISRPEGGV